MRRKYYKTKKEAQKALNVERAKGRLESAFLDIFKMPKGTRKHGWYAVCDELEYLNTY